MALPNLPPIVVPTMIALSLKPPSLFQNMNILPISCLALSAYIGAPTIISSQPSLLRSAVATE
jgi:hypothetical protein